jgi:hypothetical protein
MSNVAGLLLVSAACVFLLNAGCGDPEHEHGKSAMCTSPVTCDGDRVDYEDIKIPRIEFMVDGKQTCCMKSAKTMAGDDMSKIKFVVAGKECKDLAEAQVARLKVLGEFYKGLLTTRYAVGEERFTCPKKAAEHAKSTGKPVQYRLGAFTFKTEADAKKAAEQARAAAEKIKMQCAVGGKKFTCPKEAAEFAKSSGKKVEYRVGEATTSCETTAGTRLIEAKITTAIDILKKAANS